VPNEEQCAEILKLLNEVKALQVLGAGD